MATSESFRNPLEILLDYQKVLDSIEEGRIAQSTLEYLKSICEQEVGVIFLKQDGKTVELKVDSGTDRLSNPGLYKYLKAQNQVFNISTSSKYFRTFSATTDISQYQIIPGRWRNQTQAFFLIKKREELKDIECYHLLCNEFARTIGFCQQAKTKTTDQSNYDQYYEERGDQFTELDQKSINHSSNASDITDGSEIGVVIIDGDKIFYANLAVLKIFKYKNQKEFFKKSIFEHCSKEGQKHLKSIYERAAEGLEVPEVQNIELLKKTGVPFISQMVISDINIKGEEYKQLSFMDAGEIVKVRQKLLESEQLYRSVTETVRDIISIYDKDLNCLFISKAVENTLGFSVEEMYQKKGLELTHEQDLPQVESILNNAIRKEERRLVYSSRLRTREGAYLWMEHSMNLEYDENGQILRFIASARNINERKLTENRLKKINTQLQVRNDAINQIAILSIGNEKGEIIEVNEQFTNLMRFTEEEVIGQSYKIIKSGVHPPEFYENLWTTVKNGDIWRGEICNRDKEGGLIWTLKTIIPFQLDGNSGDRYYCSLSADITNQKERENQLQKAKDEVEKAIKIKEDFLSVMSHELRTPLNSVIGISQLLKKISADEYQNKLISTLSISAKNLLNLINDILDYSKIEAGKVNILEQPFRLKKTVENIKNSFENYAVEKGLDLELLIESDVPELIRGDELRLGQVLNNLISNAIKYTAFGFVKIKIRVSRSAEKNVNIIFEIEDSGVGIKENDLQIIFNAFEQVSRNQLSRLDGTGLGLSIVKNLVALMKGEIKVKSEFMQGTTFEVEIPFSKVENPNELLLEQVADQEELDLSSKKILYVEDVYANQFLMQNILENYHASCVIADTGMKAVELCQSTQFDMIIMDIHLPDISGHEAAERIRKFDYYKETPIIAFSANTSELTKNKVTEANMNDLLAKPIELEKLDRILRQYFAPNIRRQELDISFFRNAFSDNKVKLKNYLELTAIDIENFRDNIKDFYYAKDYDGAINELHKIEPIVSKFKFRKLLIAIKDFKTQEAFSDPIKFENILNYSADFMDAVKSVEL